ncbi:Flp pilus assembly protein TadB [Candidatus Terasakiella magnetica]|nr:Flp pilus assembly protein TadB [Candidatus Terasakiella magnetica]
MFDALARIPWEVVALVLLLLIALGGLGWFMLSLIHGPRARIRRRLAMIAGTVPAQRRGAKRKSVQARLKEVEGSRRNRQGTQLREQLMQAGFHVEVWHYMTATGLLALGILALAEVMGLGSVWGLLLAAVLGLGLPKLVLGLLAKRRLALFTSQFSDALDVVVRGIRSGLPLGECINIIGREMPEPMGAEFRLITEGQRIGLTLNEALSRAVERMPMAELRYFSIVLAIQQQTGGNLAETLAKLSEVLRSRKRMRDKVQAYASEARTSAYIIGSLPLIVIVMLSMLAPSYIGMLFSTEIGNVLLFIGGTTELIGLMVMRNMINFDM